jgi:hypothetical protein
MTLLRYWLAGFLINLADFVSPYRHDPYDDGTIVDLTEYQPNHWS